MNPTASAFSKPFRLLISVPFPRRLAEGVSEPPWSWRAAAAAVFVAFAGFKALGWVFNSNLSGGWWGALFPMLIAHAPMLCALGYLARGAGTSVTHLFGLREARAGAVLTSGIVLWILVLLLMGLAGVTLSSLGFGMGAGAGPGVDRQAVSSVLGFTDIVVWAPICEELACRALLYTSLRTCFGITLSSVATAAAFTWLHHPDSIPRAGVYFVPAVLMSLWYERTRSLWPNIISHSLLNVSCALVTLIRPQ
jgi:membrane protease YdiL (CAAX protease family)